MKKKWSGNEEELWELEAEIQKEQWELEAEMKEKIQKEYLRRTRDKSQ